MPRGAVFAMCIICTFLHSCRRSESGRQAVADGGEGSFIAIDAATIDASASVQDLPRVVAGDHHACALLGGVVFCWGENGSGQLGVATIDQRVETHPAIGHPVVHNISYDARARRVDLPSVAQIAAGRAHTCALTVDGTVYCWGANANGELGDAPGADEVRPSRVARLPRVNQLSSSEHTTCALASDGSVYLWGMSAVGFHRVTGIDRVARVIQGSSETYFIRRDAGFWWLGRNPSWGYVSAPTAAPGLGVVRDAWAHDGGCFEVAEDVSCWWVEPGDGTRKVLPVVTNVPGLRGTRRMAMGGYGTCAIDGSGKLRCWMSARSRLDPDGPWALAEEMPLGGEAVDVAVGGDFGCAVARTGAISCWGSNDYGQLGDGTLVGRVQPRAIEINQAEK